ncbi:MAG: Zn-ribbon domain-containing OB-fold protein [Candidatus Diapherotrites archaeon]|nr:Zn-ribbon domain-containing OB-fold protein [Candidatus Diapherotrites archaeon]
MNSALPLIWRKIGQRYNLEGNKCETCKEEFFPARKICPTCRRKGKLITVDMPREGIIYSFTEVFVGPTGFENETPYFLAVIELNNETKTRILSQIVDSDAKDIIIGAKVKKTFRKISDIDPEGPIAYGYKFKVMK